MMDIWRLWLILAGTSAAIGLSIIAGRTDNNPKQFVSVLWFVSALGVGVGSFLYAVLL